MLPAFLSLRVREKNCATSKDIAKNRRDLYWEVTERLPIGAVVRIDQPMPTLAAAEAEFSNIFDPGCRRLR